MAIAAAAAAMMCTSAVHSCSAPGVWSDSCASRRRGISAWTGGAVLALHSKILQPSWTSVLASAASDDRRDVPQFNVIRSGQAGLSSGNGSGSGRSSKLWRNWRWAAVAEQLQAETEENSTSGFASDFISIFFEAEGSLPEASVSKITATLEGIEGVSDVDVRASSDGSATVKLTKQMNVQATGVASGLVEVLIKGGFKLQTLNLGFDEDDGNDEDFYDYDIPTTSEETEVTE